MDSSGRFSPAIVVCVVFVIFSFFVRVAVCFSYEQVFLFWYVLRRFLRVKKLARASRTQLVLAFTDYCTLCYGLDIML
jgi:hypothetical protein